jgi:hypothetical protein
MFGIIRGFSSALRSPDTEAEGDLEDVAETMICLLTRSLLALAILAEEPPS